MNNTELHARILSYFLVKHQLPASTIQSKDSELVASQLALLKKRIAAAGQALLLLWNVIATEADQSLPDHLNPVNFVGLQSSLKISTHSARAEICLKAFIRYLQSGDQSLQGDWTAIPSEYFLSAEKNFFRSCSIFDGASFLPMQSLHLMS